MKIFAPITHFLEKYGVLLKAIASALTILGATNFIPKPWWQSPMLSWEISSQSVITLLLLILAISYFTYDYIKCLKDELNQLKESARLKSLSPEEKAEAAKKQLKESVSFFGYFLGKSKAKQL